MLIPEQTPQHPETLPYGNQLTVERQRPWRPVSVPRSVLVSSLQPGAGAVVTWVGQ